MLILGAAVAALAGPLFVSATREAEWQKRSIRAFVVAPSSPEAAIPAIVSGEAQGNDVTAVFRPENHLADGIRDAVDWLAQQPPATREVVIAGKLKEGAIAEPDLALVPASIGLRFLPQPGTVTSPSVDLQLGRMTLSTEQTGVVYGDAAEVATKAISFRSAPADERFARAARDAVVKRGIRSDRSSTRRVLVLFDGADTKDLEIKRPADSAWMREALTQLPGMSGGQAGEVLVVRVAARANNLAAAHAIDRIAHAAFFEDLRALEPRPIAAGALARWSRPPQPDSRMPVSDEGDRRWFWGLTVLLIAVETIVRRATRPPVDSMHIEEQRVA